MALTQEQLLQIEFQEAADAPRRSHEKEMDRLRAEQALALAQAHAEANMANINKQARIEAIRMAKETLIENRRSQPVGTREVTAEDITQFADALLGHINK